MDPGPWTRDHGRTKNQALSTKHQGAPHYNVGTMPRNVIGGLIQAAAPITDPSAPIEKVRQAAIDAHVPFIEEAGKKGVQILGLEEIFNGPYFCPSQDAHWYDIAESVPGPTTELMAKFAKQYKMAMVVPVYEREQAGVLLQHRRSLRRGRHLSREVP